MSIRWRMDEDYWDKLSAAEKDYLVRFHMAYYEAGKFPESWSKEERREAYNRKNVANDDLYSLSRREHLMRCETMGLDGANKRRYRNSTNSQRKRDDGANPAEAPQHSTVSVDHLREAMPPYEPAVSVQREGDADRPPAYLDSPEYKAALAAFRDCLDQTRREAAPKPTLALLRAAQRLAAITGVEMTDGIFGCEEPDLEPDAPAPAPRRSRSA